MASCDAVVWQEGLLLTPQHLQQQARFHSAQTLQSMQNALGRAWGLCELKIDHKSLTANQLVIERLVATMPSGLCVVHDAQKGSAPLKMALPTPQHSHISTLNAFVVLQHLQDGYANVDMKDLKSADEMHVSPQAKNRRFVATPVQVAEMTDAEVPAVTLLTLRANLRLALDAYDSNVDEAIHIARLRRGADGLFVTDETFMPVALTLMGAPYVHARLAHLLARARARQDALAASRTLSQASHHPERTTDLALFFELGLIRQLVAVLVGLYQCPQQTMGHVFAQLMHALGLALAARNMSLEPQLCDNRLDDQAFNASVVVLVQRIEEALAPAPTTHSTLRFVQDPHDTSLWRTPLDDLPKNAGATMVLRVAGDCWDLDADVKLWLTTVKLAAPSAIAWHVQAAVPAIGLTLMTDGPPQPGCPANGAYFAVDPLSSRWQPAFYENALALRTPTKGGTITAVELLVLRQAPKSA